MKISPQWVREFVELAVDDRRLAEDLTASGIAVEGISGSGADTVFEMEIGTNRPDAMNHYGVAREAAAIYDLPLKQLSALSSQLQGAPQRLKPRLLWTLVARLKSCPSRLCPPRRLPRTMRPSRSRWNNRSFVRASLRESYAAPASRLRRRRLRGGCGCLISGPSATPSMPPTMCCGRSANLRTFLTWICWRADGWLFVVQKTARS